MDRQWCPRERPLGKTSEGGYRGLRGLSKASITWKDPSDPSKPTSGVFQRGLSLGHHWLSIVYVFFHGSRSLNLRKFSLWLICTFKKSMLWHLLLEVWSKMKNFWDRATFDRYYDMILWYLGSEKNIPICLTSFFLLLRYIPPFLLFVRKQIKNICASILEIKTEKKKISRFFRHLPFYC